MEGDKSAPGLTRLLRESGEPELHDLVREHVEALAPAAVEAVLRNPYVSRRVIDLIVSERRLLVSREVRRLLAVHPQTPPARSLTLVGTLFWRDLVRIGADSKVPPRVRQAADRRLGERLPGLAVGERVTIARGAGPGLISRLRQDKSPRVIGALLENPRLTIGLLLPALTSEGADGKVLETVARDRKWGSRYEIRAAIAANPRTPPQAALGLLPHLKKSDLAEVSRNRKVAAVVRQRADLLRGAGS